jgi:hypothetical protein
MRAIEEGCTDTSGRRRKEERGKKEERKRKERGRNEERTRKERGVDLGVGSGCGRIMGNDR